MVGGVIYSLEIHTIEEYAYTCRFLGINLQCRLYYLIIYNMWPDVGKLEGYSSGKGYRTICMK